MKLRATIFVDIDAPDFVTAARQGDKIEETVKTLKDSGQFTNVEYDIRERRDTNKSAHTNKVHEATRRRSSKKSTSKTKSTSE